MTDDELKRLFDELRQEHVETRRHFDVSTEETRGEIRLVAESVVSVDEKLDRVAARLDEKIEKTAADTQAMITLSHAELDRRVRALEQTQPRLKKV